MAKVILSVAMSLDGYIADKNGSVDWLACTHESGIDYGFPKFLRSIDVIAMGKNSYQQMLTFGDWPFTDKKTYVFTDQADKPVDNSITFFPDTIQDFMKQINIKNLRSNIWLFGGAQLIQSFYTAGLIDEYILTIVPVSLGAGLALPEDIIQIKGLTEIESKTFKDGVKQIHLINK